MDICYHSHLPKSSTVAAAHTKTHQGLGRYLAYRDIPSFISHYVNGKKTLDYGAGTGISTQFLQTQGLDVTGVDVSKEMLVQAEELCPQTPFYQIESGCIPVPSDSYDLVFSSFVLVEMASEQETRNYLKEAKRVLKPDGVFIAVTYSQDAYSKKWILSIDTDYPENKTLTSGKQAKLYHRSSGIEFTNFYWTEADYRYFFKQEKFELMKAHYPVGKESEPYPWKEELTNSPFVIFVAKK